MNSEEFNRKMRIFLCRQYKSCRKMAEKYAALYSFTSASKVIRSNFISEERKKDTPNPQIL